MKKAGTVILYNPRLDGVKKNILSYLDYIDTLYIIDNSSINNSAQLPDNPKIKYLANLQNLGVASALNKAAHQAIDDGFDILLTMDQDSFFTPKMIRDYITLTDNIDWGKISMIGISPVRENKEATQNKQSSAKLTPAKLIITSGSLLNLKLFNNIGGFNEKLFIDWVDYDYCLRSILSGYKIFLSDIEMPHVGGTPTKFMGRNIALYSPERYYYIFRNHIAMWIEYFRFFPKLIMRNFFVTISLSLLPNIILSKEKKNFILSLIRAIKDIPRFFWE